MVYRIYIEDFTYFFQKTFKHLWALCQVILVCRFVDCILVKGPSLLVTTSKIHNSIYVLIVLTLCNTLSYVVVQMPTLATFQTGI